MIALNAHDDLEQIGQVQSFIDKIGVEYDVGFETTGTYRAIAGNFAGLNPFPIDVIVDRDGRIVHIQREYDPDALADVLERLLEE